MATRRPRASSSSPRHKSARDPGFPMSTTTAPLPTSSPPTAQRLFSVLAAAFLGWMFDGLEMGIFPLIARPALQDMMPAVADLKPDQFVGLWMSYITALFLVGAALGG